MSELNINKESLPSHLVIIPDGNRRWAKKRGLHPWFGHRAGAKALEKILKIVDELDIFCFSFWAASRDNILKRSKKEVSFLLELFRINFNRLLKEKRIYEKKMKVNFFGDWQKYFPVRVKSPMEKLIEATKNYHDYFLNFFIMYDGQEEMLEAIRKIVKKSKGQPQLKITEQTLKENLLTKELPPVDFLIRTGVDNDPHWSAGFMMWDCAYSQFYFTKTFWPAFGQEEFLKALKDYQKRERRFGA